MTLNMKFDAVAFDAAAARARAAEEAGRPRTLVVFAGKELAMADAAKALLTGASEQITRAAAAARFKGKAGSALEILAPAGIDASRLLLVGVATGGDEEIGRAHV